MPKTKIKKLTPQRIKVGQLSSLPDIVEPGQDSLDATTVAPALYAQTLEQLRNEEERKQKELAEQQRREREALQQAGQPGYSTD